MKRNFSFRTLFNLMALVPAICVLLALLFATLGNKPVAAMFGMIFAIYCLILIVASVIWYGIICFKDKMP